MRIAAFLGGPLAAGYIIAENYKAFNEFGKAKRTWLYTLLATVAVIGIGFLPMLDRVPGIVFPVLYSILAYQVITIFQGKQIAAYLANGGSAFGWGRPTAVGLVGCAVLVVVILFLLLVTGQLSELSGI